jgi:hypothetical protein
MEQLVKIRILFLLFFLPSKLIYANPCEGVGTVFFFGNGMFTSIESAQDSLKRLKKEVKRGLTLEKLKDIKYDIAYKINEDIHIQILNVATHKGVDNWENYWLWLSSLKQPPEWFQKKILELAGETLKNGASSFDEIQGHFEKYSQYIRKGYNVILISHSQGNLYANQTMRKLSHYTDSSLTGSLTDKRKENSLFPDFLDLFGNVQVATPVIATVSSSPWSTFNDDLVMVLVREKLGGALPGNLKTLGIGLPPDGDLWGHSFVKAYLRNDESKQKILSDIQTQYNKL